MATILMKIAFITCTQIEGKAEYATEYKDKREHISFCEN